MPTLQSGVGMKLLIKQQTGVPLSVPILLHVCPRVETALLGERPQSVYKKPRSSWFDIITKGVKIGLLTKLAVGLYMYGKGMILAVCGRILMSVLFPLRGEPDGLSLQARIDH